MEAVLAGTQGAPFRYIDLFAGIGGFAAALEAFGGRCVYSVEIDQDAAAVYQRNWGHAPCGARADGRIWGDITEDANDQVMNVPAHDVLAAGFPCQPFSKSGYQMGMEETRGTLFWNILRIIQAHHPTIVLLENVRNLAGPRHRHEWDVIILALREQGYRVAQEPAVFSPHLLPRELGGRPQVRERVFITATYDPQGCLSERVDVPLRNVSLRGGLEWDLMADLPVDSEHSPEQELSPQEHAWITAWDDFVRTLWVRLRGQSGQDVKLPGFPLWADRWVTTEELSLWMAGHSRPAYRHAGDLPDLWNDVPGWKQNFLIKNAQFYTAHQAYLDAWMRRHGIENFPASRRKLEWQAQQAQSLWDCVLQMRPSGIRAKRATHLPALVAITQTSIIGPRRRRISPREAARLQGFPDNFDFGAQSAAVTYKQLGNGVNIGAVWNMLRAHAVRDQELLARTAQGQALYQALCIDSPESPDSVLESLVAARQALAQRLLIAV